MSDNNFDICNLLFHWNKHLLPYILQNNWFLFTDTVLFFSLISYILYFSFSTFFFFFQSLWSQYCHLLSRVIWGYSFQIILWIKNLLMIFEIPSKASDEMQRHTRNALEFQIFCVIFTLVQLTSQNCPSPFMYIHILLFILCLHNFSINSFAMIIKLFCCMGHLFLTGCFVSNASIEKVIFCFY